MNFGFVPTVSIGNEERYSTSTAEPKLQNTRGHKVVAMASRGDAVPQVDIDDEGVFKYILIKMYEKNYKDDNDFKYLVRGYARGEYHMDIYEEVNDRVSPLGLDLQCVGGGRIEHSPSEKKIFVYGYSQGYGRAKHATVCDLLKKKYPHYTNIDWSDDGY